MTNDVVSKQANKIKWTRMLKMPKEIKVCHQKNLNEKQEFGIGNIFGWQKLKILRNYIFRVCNKNSNF